MTYFGYFTPKLSRQLSNAIFFYLQRIVRVRVGWRERRLVLIVLLQHYLSPSKTCIQRSSSDVRLIFYRVLKLTELNPPCWKDNFVNAH